MKLLNFLLLTCADKIAVLNHVDGDCSHHKKFMKQLNSVFTEKYSVIIWTLRFSTEYMLDSFFLLITKRKIRCSIKNCDVVVFGDGTVLDDIYASYLNDIGLSVVLFSPSNVFYNTLCADNNFKNLLDNMVKKYCGEISLKNVESFKYSEYSDLKCSIVNTGKDNAIISIKNKGYFHQKVFGSFLEFGMLCTKKIFLLTYSKHPFQTILQTNDGKDIVLIDNIYDTGMISETDFSKHVLSEIPEYILMLLKGIKLAKKRINPEVLDII